MIPFSILDLAPVAQGSTPADALRNSLNLARRAEELGFKRFWLAEHHGMKGIASAATAVVIGYVAGGTKSIRVGSGGIMLPNHAPLVVAEQFGTLASLYPDRIDLGLGRAPGTDQLTARALRRDLASRAEHFPNDVQELQAYFAPAVEGQTLRAVPGEGLKVPLWILGSSLYGAQVAAALGLPYAFASHFAPQALEAAVAVYREQFRPSAQLDSPYVIAGVNVLAADTADAAAEQLAVSRRVRAAALFGRGRELSDAQADELLAQGAAVHVDQMLTYAAVGTPDDVRDYLEGFRKLADADELIVAHQAPTVADRLRSVELTAQAMQPADG
jgi:luciferase family oxidoreductase group 1